MNTRLVRIRFDLDSGDWHRHASESLWAAPTPESGGEVFEIRNSPFFAMNINYLDLVTAVPTANAMRFTFTGVVKRGGHSTYMVLIPPDEARRLAYWKRLENIGCSYESSTIDVSMGKRLLYSVDVPPTTDLHEAYDMLVSGHDDGVWIFQEGYAYETTRARLLGNLDE